jgi:membrane fusion protein (multidrug efflux system)
MKTLGVLLAALALLPSPITAEEKRPVLPPAKVVVARIQEKTVVENTPIIGVLYFDKVSSLSTEVAGLVKSVHFREGDRVKKGGVLLTLNTDFIDKDIELAVTKIEQISVQIEKTDKDLTRFKRLYHQQAIPEREYDDVGFKRRDLIKQRDALKKQLEIARLKKAKSFIQAPFNGVILAKKAEVGDWIAPGRELCRIGSSEDVFVKVPVAEELLVYSNKGHVVDVTVNAFDKKLKGTIVGIMPVADARTKNVMLKIRLPRMETAVENLSATVFVPVSGRKRLKLVPRDALVTLQGKDIVFTVNDNKAVPVPIHIVSFLGEFAGIKTSDVPDGTMVVVDGNERLRPEQPVEIIKTSSEDKSS